MATARPFAYNTGSTITGTIQIGTLAIGTPTNGFQSTGLQWWNGPDEELGYVIAQSVSENTQPTPISGVTASVGFYRSDVLTENSFLEITNYVANKNGTPQNFTGGTEAATWLNDNGYWTSYGEIVVTPTPTVTTTPTNTTTPTPSITASQTQTPSNTVTQTQTPTPSITASQTQTPTPSITATQTQTPTPTPTPANANNFTYTNFASTTGLVLVGSATNPSNTINVMPNTGNSSGNVYRTTTAQYNRNFSVTWAMLLDGGSATPADGFTLQWTTTNNTAGGVGGGCGIIAASSTINALVFATYTANNLTWYKANSSQGAQLTSQNWYRQLYYWLDYNHAGSTMSLYYSTTTTKPSTANKVMTSFTFDTGNYYIGFGAACGGAVENHKLQSWSLIF